MAETQVAGGPVWDWGQLLHTSFAMLYRSEVQSHTPKLGQIFQIQSKQNLVQWPIV